MGTPAPWSPRPHQVMLIDDLEAPVQGGSHNGLPSPLNLVLEFVLGKMPQKEFLLKGVRSPLRPQEPPGMSVLEALVWVFWLLAVASKRYLSNKVDRSVTVLVAQQQCVGPLHTPLADVAVVALSHLNTTGAAAALGEQPIKGLLEPGAGALLDLSEALTNLVFTYVTDQHMSVDGGYLGAVGDGGEMPPPPHQPMANGDPGRAGTQLWHLRLHGAHRGHQVVVTQVPQCHCGHQVIVTQEPWSHHSRGCNYDTIPMRRGPYSCHQGHGYPLAIEGTILPIVPVVPIVPIVTIAYIVSIV
ncbi:LOW QUALITY PROTEIN: phosphoribosylformylglycinamidine synthase-like [Guaruba guarouba]